MEKLVVLDYNTAEVHVYNVGPEDLNISKFLKSKGHRSATCNWMFTTNLIITRHDEQENN